MWQTWLIVVIILLIATYRHPSYSLFYWFQASSIQLMSSFFTHNLLLECFCFILLYWIISHLPIPHFIMHYLKLQKPLLHSDELVHQIGQVVQSIDASANYHGLVKINRSIWIATSTMPIKKGTLVQAQSIEGLRLIVQPLSHC